MTNPKFIEIDGKHYLWTEILQLRREQMLAFAKAKQPALFEVNFDRRATADRTAAGRYLEPTMFSHPTVEG